MKLSRRSAIHLAVCSLTIGLVLTAAAPGRADQFVLFQQTFEITKATVDRAGSHYFVRGPMLTQPPGNDWTKPVDYRNGTVYIQTEVLEKPASGEPNHWSYCYMPNRPIGPGYGCAGSGRYTEKGVYAHPEKMTSWWQNNAISWPQGIKEMHLVIKGIGDSGHLHKRTDVDKLYPSRVRITMVQVSAGATFDPSKVPGWVASSDADGGAPDTAPASDAGNSEGTGGAGGSGGSGSGGAGGSTGSGGAGGSGSGETGGSGGASPSTGTGGSSAPSTTGGSTGTPGVGSGGSGGSSATGGTGSTPTARRPTVAGGCSFGPGATSTAPLALIALALFAVARSRRRDDS